MEGTIYRTKEAVLRRAQEIIGIPLGKVDIKNRLSTGKGAIGNVIEEGWFGYKPNSDAEADFPEAEVELKVTPYICTSKGIRAKERLVCSIINYMTEYQKTFEESDFWRKNKTLLIMSYEHKDGVPKSDFSISKAVLFGFPETDLIIIKQDWEKIIEKIRAGKAHLLTEGETMYLAACTKGATAESVREQPFSDIPAKQRAYSLKSSYMTRVLNTYIFGNEQDERIIKDWHELENSSFEDVIIKKIKPYLGKTQEELKKEFGVKSTAKNLNEVLLSRMLGVSGKIAYTEEFQNANIIPKTIRIQRNGKIKESMSFPTFKFMDLVREDWENSTLRNYLAPAKFLFIVFKEREDGEYIFEKIKFWNIPAEDLEEVHNVWERTVNIIREGVILEKTSSGVKNNLPKQSENRVAHVRPHGKDSSDKLPLPDGRMMTKQCFWLNSKYIEEQIK